MGDIAEAMVEGDFCECCGVWLCDDIGPGPGYPRRCEGCAPVIPAKKADKVAPGKVRCRICGKAVKKGQGIKDHLNTVHGKRIKKIRKRKTNATG